MSSAICVYEKCNFQGQSFCFPAGEYAVLTTIEKAIGQAINSIKLYPGFKVTIYQYKNFLGDSQILTADSPCLSTIAWDDKIQSFKVESSSAPATTPTSTTSPTTTPSPTSTPSPTTTPSSTTTTATSGGTNMTMWYIIFILICCCISSSCIVGAYFYLG